MESKHHSHTLTTYQSMLTTATSDKCTIQYIYFLHLLSLSKCFGSSLEMLHMDTNITEMLQWLLHMDTNIVLLFQVRPLFKLYLK